MLVERPEGRSLTGFAGAKRGADLAKRTELFSCRLTPEEFDAWKAAAAAQGLTVTGWLTRITAEAIRGRRHLTTAERDGLAALIEQTRRIGVNLNQLAHAVNRATMPAPPPLPDAAAIERLFAELQDLRAKLSEAAAL